MKVYADQVEVGGGERLAYGFGGGARLYGKAELAVKDAGCGRGVRVRIHARREAQHNVLADAAPSRHFVQQR